MGILQKVFIKKNKLAKANRKDANILSVVIVGGNECMERRYVDVCAAYNCKAKVYTKMAGNMKNIGSPDLLVLFTGTMSHKMLRSVMQDTKGQSITVARSRQSSVSALKSILEAHA